MIIRAAIRSDLGAILRLLRELGDTAHMQSAHVRMSSAAVRAWTRMESDPDRTILVAEERGQIIGTLDLLVVANLTHDAQPWAVVDNVVVDPQLRRRGIGRALVEDALDRATRAGCYKVELLSHESPDGVRKFYAALGFSGSALGFRRRL
ncbi:GNAT family N-acetyltransferase [Nocardiopsis algeriensis]|uniref:GNAT superfamily N-acetyltransferase n=1 Tax=Nocardiopsis algeriensis TaxID=1478215 RepID=A0A841IJT3_9ACTN|nr:GNAT family N-acetyltransferase [Nocardiopsis algeriensis]MBB6118390.1 GNAT superfamily N-acetyltransferase [Nocardiopsis algeriensis]